MSCFRAFVTAIGTTFFLASVVAGLGSWARAEEPEAVTPTAEAQVVKSSVLVLDPGHGGADLGQRISPTLVEKEFTLKLAQEVKTLMSKDPGKTVWLTRTQDKDVSLVVRETLANAKHAQVFLSLHAADTRLNPPQIGLYTHSINENNEALDILVNQAKDKKFEVIPWERAQEAFASAGERLTKALKGSLESMRWEHGSAPEVHEQKLPLVVLTGVRAPAVMVELPVPQGISGKAYDAYVRRLAEALVAGIHEFVARR